MSQFRDIFQLAAAPILGDALGDTVTYTPAGGVAVEVVAIPGQLRTEEHELGTGQLTGMGRARYRAWAVSPGQLAGTPRENDVITVGGQTWVVASVEQSGGGMWRLFCMLDQQVNQIGILAGMLRHVCLLERPVAVGADGIGHTTETWQVIDPAAPCNFADVQRQQLLDTLEYATTEPTLAVAADYDIQARDRVSLITVADTGLVIAAGPYYVTSVHYPRIDANRKEARLEAVEA